MSYFVYYKLSNYATLLIEKTVFSLTFNKKKTIANHISYFVFSCLTNFGSVEEFFEPAEDCAPIWKNEDENKG
jgi:hypothetical protein